VSNSTLAVPSTKRLLSYEELTEPLNEELRAFRGYFNDQLRTEVPLLGQVLRYLTRQRGKQMRPLLVLLSARLFGEVNERTYLAASMIELLHTATLVHDDVVDEANRRRGFLSINTIWKNKVGVLIGDFLLSKGLLIALDNDQYAMLRTVSKAVKRMSEGELRQLQASKLFNLTEQTYFQIIEEKTASLLAACCECGALTHTEEPDKLEIMHDMGIAMGIAFQIRDDLLDYGTQSIGKPRRNDIIQRKLTLPILHVLDKVSASERRSLRAKLRKKKKTKAQIEEIVQIVHDKGGIAHAEKQMQHYLEKAESLLNQIQSSQKEPMRQYMQFVIHRNK
jgi:octaprenyl-diphosphate synthase